MKILFNLASGLPVHGKILEERSLGGTEAAVIRISEAIIRLNPRAEVTVRSSLKEIPAGTESVMGVRYVPLGSDIKVTDFSCIILVQDWRPIIYLPTGLPVYLWTGDGYEQNSNMGIGDRRISGKLAGLIAVSKWHAETLSRASWFPQEKIHILGNGVADNFFADSSENVNTRIKNRLIYHSAPYRGLREVISFFSILQKRLSSSAAGPELHIYSDMELYRRGMSYQGPHQNVLDRIKSEASGMAGLHFHPTLPHRELAEVLKKSSIFPYPSTVEETFCMSLAEAMAAGVVPVVSSRGALPEVIGENELVVDANLPKDEFNEKFISILEKLLTDDSYLKEMSNRMITRVKKFYTWDIMAKRFIGIIRGER
ncbi:MAG TPA: glycosyltransferase family 4 protein [Oligoflexia bacterium]|nr:glycosyltransferase family 4 protein [Oligoflexia bacterium]HMP48525.1 glycosyltransferase family 4 protein [Oligoflexia bacterium]